MSNFNNRKGSGARLALLIALLVAVGAGCIYEFSVARPEFQKAWEQIKEIDASNLSGEITSDDITKRMGREPADIDSSRQDAVVYTYAWMSGMLFKSHKIRVVFVKSKEFPDETGELRQLTDKLYYYSAAANKPLDPEKNFPPVTPSVVVNLNPPPLGRGGGPAPQASDSSNDDDKEKQRPESDDDDADSDEASKSSGDGSKDAEKKDQQGDKETADKKEDGDNRE